MTDRAGRSAASLASPLAGPLVALARDARARLGGPRRALGLALALGALAIVGLAGGSSPVPAARAAGAEGSVVGVAAPLSLDLVDIGAKTLIVLAVLFVTLRLLGRVGGSGPRRAGRLTVLESRTLAAKASLHLVAVGERRLVVGLTPAGMVALAELDASELPDEETGTAEVGAATDAPGVAAPAWSGLVAAIRRPASELSGLGGRAR